MPLYKNDKALLHMKWQPQGAEEGKGGNASSQRHSEPRGVKKSSCPHAEEVSHLL